MFRRQLFSVAKQAFVRPQLQPVMVARPSVNRLLAVNQNSSVRFYSITGSGLTKDEVEKRIISVFKSFDKVSDPSKITGTSKFSTDLGLDSLDTVEVIVAVEEEFGIEIPDNQADELKSIDDTVAYILAQPEGK